MTGILRTIAAALAVALVLRHLDQAEEPEPETTADADETALQTFYA
jgi:hypothetical protein